jgi:alkylation response protein AidB-like acyl-CoA dehydrogenase
MTTAMEILSYNPEQIDFRKRLRQFCNTHIIPHVDQWEKDGIIPRDVWREFGGAGFLCPDVDPAYGGLGGDFRYAVIVSEELARTRHTGLAANLHSDVVVPYINSYGSPEIRERVLPGCVSGDIVTAVAMTEPGAGSDLAGMTTTAAADGDQVILNGSKTFISNGIHADLVVVAAREADMENPYEGLSLYLVDTDTPGFKRGRKLEKMGWHSQDTAELFFTNCRIPTANRLGDKGMGFLMLMEKLQQERLVCAVGAVTGAEVILEWVTDYLKTTVVGGRPLVKSQAVQFALVEMATDVRMGRTFVDKLCADHMEGLQIVIETSMAKYWTTDMVSRIAERALDLCGPAATLESCPLVRAWRDVRVMSIFAGTNEIMKGIVAKFMGL